MARVAVVGNPSDLSDEEMLRLENVLRGAGVESVERAERPRRGYAVTWWQVVGIYVGARAGDALISAVVTAVVDWTKERFESRARPQSVTIYGPDGDVIKAIEVLNEGEVRDVTDEKEGEKRPPPDGIDLT
jgi:hypothetical protein